jgi:hypothetical protein
MNLDDLLNAPLASVRDDGFSARILLRLEQTRQRQMTLLWSMIAAAVLPLLWFLPLADLGAYLPRGMAIADASSIFAYGAGTLVLAWAWHARVLRF